MNYKRIYDQLIFNAKLQNRQKGSDVYYEQHHIIPKCLGGTDDSDNLINLTAREHYVAHKLLCEIYPNESKLLYALWMMSNVKYDNRKYIITSREYERIRQLYVKRHITRLTNRIVSTETCNKISNSKLGHVVSDSTKRKISEALIGKPGTWIGKTHSIESKKKMSDAAKGRKATDATKKKMSESRLGKIHSNSSKQKMSDAAKGKHKPKFTCKYCGQIIGGRSNINRHENTHK